MGDALCERSERKRTLEIRRINETTSHVQANSTEAITAGAFGEVRIVAFGHGTWLGLSGLYDEK